MLHRRSTRPSAPKRLPKTVRPTPCDRSPHIVDRTSTRALDDPLRVTFWHFALVPSTAKCWESPRSAGTTAK